MVKKIITIGLVILFSMNSIGCSGTWRRKFIRKKKEDTRGPILEPKDYAKEFTNKQFYANHYAFWKNSESELISSLKAGKSPKRLDVYSDYCVAELQKLHDLLIEEKQIEIAPYVGQLREIVAKIRKPGYASSHRNQLANLLRKHYRIITKEFPYHKMKGFVSGDEGEVVSKEIPEKKKGNVFSKFFRKSKTKDEADKELIPEANKDDKTLGQPKPESVDSTDQSIATYQISAQETDEINSKTKAMMESVEPEEDKPDLDISQGDVSEFDVDELKYMLDESSQTIGDPPTTEEENKKNE
ncbi:hypothetical protein ACFL0T_08075 [Candidatus Omnitrophota bacterium]